MIPLSFQVEDTNLDAIRERYVSYILAHQDPHSGWLGPKIGPASDPNSPKDAYWGKYDAIQALVLVETHTHNAHMLQSHDCLQHVG